MTFHYFLLDHESYGFPNVQELGLIEKTQAWSAMKETVLVSLLSCVNVLSRAGEGEEKEKEKYKQSRRWRTDRGLKQIKLRNESVENQVDIEVKGMSHQVFSDGIGGGKKRRAACEDPQYVSI